MIRTVLNFWYSLWSGPVFPYPLNLMTCGRKNHYWKAAKYSADDCPVCNAVKEQV